MTFDALPGNARLWVHVADRTLDRSEQEQLERDLAEFLKDWSAHGNALVAAGGVFYDRVLVVGLDEAAAGATGCSIDKLIAFMRVQGAALGVDWFDRHQVMWREPGSAAWNAARTAEFWAMRKAGVVSGSTEVLDPLAASVGEARSERGVLVRTFDESWHAEMWK